MVEQVKTRMAAAEFFQLPESMQQIELLDGEVDMSPAPVLNHQRFVGNLYTLLRGLAPDGEVFVSPVDVYFDDPNITQPDVLWVSAHNTNCIPVEGKYLRGAPDLVVEVLSPGTARKDKKTKLELYQRYGVREYWIGDAANLYLEVRQNQNGTFVLQGIYGPGDTFELAALGRKTVDLSAVFALGT